MAKHGAFFVYGGQAPKEQWDIISNDEYRLEARKTWIQRTEQWHIEFIHYDSDQFPHRCEMFLTKEEIARLKEIL